MEKEKTHERMQHGKVGELTARVAQAKAVKKGNPLWDDEDKT